MLKTVLRILGLSLLIFTAIRLCYLALYSEFFAELAWPDALRGFLVGWRFDLSISAVAILIFVLPFVLPTAVPARRQIITVGLWGAFIALCLLWMLSLGDLLYFGEVFRHAGREVALLTEDYGLMFEIALERYGMALLLPAAAVGILAWVWRRLIIRPAQQHIAHGRYGVVGLCLALVVLVLSVRGLLLDGKPIAVVDAYAAGTEKAALLALNGAFSIVHSVRRFEAAPKPLALLSDEELQKAVERYHWDKEDPFIRQWGNGGAMDKRNVVIVLLESWSARYIDGLSGTQYGATPFFDSLIEKSRVWVNAFAAGQRSIEGIQAVLTSVPVLPNHPVIGWGLEQNRIPRLADIFDSQGYQSVMVQSSNRRSYHMDGIAALSGFDEYFGKEDMPLLRSYPQETPRFGWDYETLMFLASHLETRPDPDRPFLAFAFTGTTHEPFANPGSEFHLHPHETNTEGAYLNTLRYSDWSLEQFMERMSQQPWYSNTVFVFMADHVMKADQDIFNSFHIPFLIYTPDGSLPPAKETRFASQYDLLPTLMTLLGIDGATASFGHSLLTLKSKPEGVLVQRGDTTGWLGPEGWFAFNASSLVEVGGTFADNEMHRVNVESWLKASLQLADWRLKKNLWVARLADR